MEETKVRKGKIEDLDGVMTLGRMCVEENGLLPMDVSKTLAEIYGALQGHGGVVGVVEGPDGMIEAAVLLRLDTMPYSAESLLVERAVYVHPDYRAARGGRASRLLEFAKEVATYLEIPLLIGELSNDRTEAKRRLYERHFGPPAGYYWLWGARTGQHKETVD